ncbi:MAG: SAM-dependent chlorinase/fluorinase [Mariprofundales bacterium]
MPKKMPMIAMFTDFGLAGPYVGQMEMVLRMQAPTVPIINLFADLPRFDPKAAAYLLPAYIQQFPENTIFLCVIDPGVGTQRRPLIVYVDNYWFVGPDNGLFSILMRRAKYACQWRIDWRPAEMSISFHGRDLFAPVAAMLATGKKVAMQELEIELNRFSDWPIELAQIIYIDHYGNAITGIRTDRLPRSRRLCVHGVPINHGWAFDEADDGEPFWYGNSNGLVEIASKRDSAARILRLELGLAVTVIS